MERRKKERETRRIRGGSVAEVLTFRWLSSHPAHMYCLVDCVLPD